MYDLENEINVANNKLLSQIQCPSRILQLYLDSIMKEYTNFILNIVNISHINNNPTLEKQEQNNNSSNSNNSNTNSSNRNNSVEEIIHINPFLMSDVHMEVVRNICNESLRYK